jgi:3',5'-cyclic AMP phosphodiesterase CpdA
MMIVDPRDGDAEDDRSSPKARSLTTLAGGILAEISPVKLVLAIVLLIALPNLAVGVAPLAISAWISTVSDRAEAAASLGSAAVIGTLVLAALLAWRPLFGIIETNFWSLNSLLVQPAYMLVREALRHLATREGAGIRTAETARRDAALTAMGAGLVVAFCAIAIVLMVWPATRWWGTAADLVRPSRLILPSLANAIALLGVYAAGAAMVWAFADAGMDAVIDMDAFDEPVPDRPVMRVAHLTDIHAVGEPYGFRIECGRDGPRGNERFDRLLQRLDAMHAAEPLHLLLITGDMTDAGRAAEWALFLAAMERYPALMAIALTLPGNHDVSIIDRANPARLELPWAASKQLRRLRQISVMAHLHGARTRVFEEPRLGTTRPLNEALLPHRETLRRFAGTAGLRDGLTVARIWRESFPLIVPPAAPDGLGVILLDTNAETHFSFSNALGFLSLRQAAAVEVAMRAHPGACWIVAMHHHLVEYPTARSALAIRLGTALVNGSWVVRQLKRHGARIVVMHGHRHVDWTGRCGPVRIVSAPSPVMGARDHEPSYCLIQRLQAVDGRLMLLSPETIALAGQPRPTPVEA